MTDCPNGEMRDLLPDLLHEGLAPAERARVAAHIASCAECRAELALLERARASLHRVPAVDVAAIVRALPARQAPERRGLGGWRAAAAIAAIAIGGASVAIARHDASTPLAPVAVATVTAAPGDSVVVAPPVAAPATVAESAAPSRVAEASAQRELAVAGAVSDLSDHELAALLSDLGSLDAIPASTADIEGTSLAPAISAPKRGTS